MIKKFYICFIIFSFILSIKIPTTNLLFNHYKLNKNSSNFLINNNKNSSKCDDLIYEYLINFDPMNFTNPLVLSGTGYNDFGKYDNCLEYNLKYYINKIFFNVTQDKFIKNFSIYTGFCLAQECYSKDIIDEYNKLIYQDTFNISLENVSVIMALEENKKYKKYDVIFIILLIIFLILTFFTSGIITYFYYKGCPCKLKNEINDKIETINIDSAKRINSITAISSYLEEQSENNKNNNYISNNIENDEQKYKKMDGNYLTLLFDISLNSKKLFDIDKKKLSSIKFIYSLKFILIFIYMFCKMCSIFVTYPLPMRDPEGNLEYIRSFYWQFYFNMSYVSLDIYYFLCAFSLIYNHKNFNDNKYFILKIIHKFCKFYIAYIIIFILYKKFLIFCFTGPLVGYLFNNEIENCNKNFYKIIFGLQNFIFNNNKENWNYNCFEWSYFIINLFYFYIIGNILLIIYNKNKKIFISIISFLCLLSMVFEFILINNNDFGINFYQYYVLNKNNYVENYEHKIYSKISIYFFGLLFGYFFKEKNEKNNDDKDLNKNKYKIIFYINLLIFFILIFISYFLYDENNEETMTIKYNKIFYILINLFMNKLYLICIMFIIKCLYVNQILLLNNNFYLYFHKLLLPIYLFATIFFKFLLIDSRYLLFFDGWYILFYGSGCISLTYIMGLLITLFYIIPFDNLKYKFFDAENILILKDEEDEKIQLKNNQNIIEIDD